MDFKIINFRLAYAALIILAIGIFTSVTVSAVSHILMLIPGFYFLWIEIKNGDLQLKKSSYCLLLLLLIVICSVVFNIDIIKFPIKNILKGKYFLMGILGIFLLRHLFNHYLDHRKKKILFHVFIWATTLATLSGLIALWTGFNPIKMKAACHPTRACGVYGMYMTYGYGISLFTVLLSGILIFRKQVKNIIDSKWIVLALIINLAGLFFSFARGGWLGLILALPFFFFKNNKKYFIAVIGLAIFGFGMAFSFSDKVQDTFLKRQGSNERRIEFFKTALYAFKEKPFLGWGYRNFEPNVKNLKKKYGIGNQHFAGHAHNNFLEHLASTGIIGLLVLLLFFFFWALEMYYRDDVWGKIIFPFIISLVISGMFQYTFGDGENLFLIMIIYSLSQVFPDQIKGEIV